MSGELTTGDLRTVLHIVRVVHEADSLADFRRVVPQLVLTAVPGNLAGYNEINVETGESYVSYSPDSAALALLADRFPALSREHPTLQHMARTRDGSAVTISDVQTREEYRASRLYRELFCEMDVQDQIVIGLPSPQPIIIGVPVNRGSWGFQRRERELLNALRPHLTQAHAHAARRDLLCSALATRDAALEHSGTGVIRLVHGQVVDASTVARRWLDRGLLEGDRFTGDLRDWYLHERQRLSTVDELPDVASPFRVRRDGTQATIRMLDDATILIDEVASTAPSVHDLRRLGLSPAEAAVLHEVVAGMSISQTAAHLNITGGTVRKHLQSTFRKLGVHSRPAAVALALNAQSARGH